MKRICVAILLLLLLSGCIADQNISVSTSRCSASVCTHNGYQVTGYNIQHNEDGSYTITVMAEKGGGNNA